MPSLCQRILLRDGFFFLYDCLSYGGFSSDHMIHCGFSAPKVALEVGKMIVGFYEPVAERTNFQLCVRPPLNHVVIYIFKFIVCTLRLLPVVVTLLQSR